MQAAQLLVHVDQAGRDTGQPTIALVGGIGHVNRIGYGLEKALKTAFNLTLFGQFVERLFSLNDLFTRLVCHVNAGGFGGDVTAKGDQITAHGQIVNHLRIVAYSESGDGCTGKTGQICGAAQFLQAFVIFHKRLQRHRAGEVVLCDAGGGNLENTGMYGIIEMLGTNNRSDTVVDVVIGQDRAQQLLLGLDGMGHRLGRLNGNAGSVE